MKYFILLYSILITIQGYCSFTPPIIDINDIYSKIKDLKDSTITRDFHGDFFKNLLFKNDSTAYLNPNGTLHLFEINFDSTVKIKKISKSIYHGTTFNRYLFLNNEKIYSFGGTGLWSKFPKLLEFNFKNKEWFNKKIYDYPRDVTNVICSWKIGNKIKVLLTVSPKPDKSNKFNFVFGEIDLTNFTFLNLGAFKSTISQQLSFGNGIVINESDQYLIFERSRLDNCYYGIFDKAKGEVLYSNLFKNIPCFDGTSYGYLKDSALFYRNSSNNLDSVMINESTIYDRVPIQQIYYDRILESKIYKISAYAIVFILLSILSIILIKKINLNSYSGDEIILKIEKRLLISKGSTIKREELDQLLGIAHLSFDSIKSKRSSMIRTINDNGRLKIERIRKEDDKRFFKYSIN